MSGNEPALVPSKCLVAGGPRQFACGTWEQRNGCRVWDKIREWHNLALGECSACLGWKR